MAEKKVPEAPLTETNLMFIKHLLIFDLILDVKVGAVVVVVAIVVVVVVVVVVVEVVEVVVVVVVG